LTQILSLHDSATPHRNISQFHSGSRLKLTIHRSKMLPAAGQGSAALSNAFLSVLPGYALSLSSRAQALTVRRLLQQAIQPPPAAESARQRAAQQCTGNPLAVAQVRTLAMCQRQRHRHWMSSCSGSVVVNGDASSTTTGVSWQQFSAVSRAVLPALGLQLTANSNSRGLVTTALAADDAPAEEDAPRRRRRSATESKAALRRTTVSTPDLATAVLLLPGFGSAAASLTGHVADAYQKRCCTACYQASHCASSGVA
jgi:hypothetical protein